ncbi:MAG: hypothetical protein N4J56_001732 [Chroococcidiopsis sp. SAG 2025]|uniref:prepilin-type N-terminal cleavage/methylation domain-containing protein n=1 Tax=Chroococcidiopsis sp. SAG 2025 TaxID=171389 RepID=UPI002936F890|nr:prepilin-type N-terminal cleavage/methylation domain-containing protein [Chroococcidiopsis sp. SAG 2025]MDV2992078.1 hypothetical protein [Chroococcidiopsis sp. SAG 2025]
MFKRKLPNPEHGFTMLEVLVAIVVAVIFVSVAIQMMVLATVFKVRAQEYTEATNWIQEDLENIKYQAASYQYTSLVDEATGDNTHESTDTVLYLASVDDFQAGDTVIVGTDSTNNKIAVGGVNAGAATITLDASLDTSWLTDTAVVGTTRCNPADRYSGFADGLRDKVAGSDNDASTSVEETLYSKLFTSKAYIRQRTLTIVDAAPYRVLKVEYKISPGTTFDASKVIASFDTEVIPNAALQCPN